MGSSTTTKNYDHLKTTREQLFFRKFRILINNIIKNLSHCLKHFSEVLVKVLYSNELFLTDFSSVKV